MKEKSKLEREITFGDIRVNTLTKLFILLLLYDKPRHGYDLMKELNEILPYKVSPEQVYPFLKLLKEESMAKITETGERDKKVYCLTDKGRETVEYLMSRFSELIEIAIKPNVKTCAHCGVQIVGEGYKEVIDDKELTFCCIHCAKHYKETRMKIKKG